PNRTVIDSDRLLGETRGRIAENVWPLPAGTNQVTGHNRALDPRGDLTRAGRTRGARQELNATAVARAGGRVTSNRAVLDGHREGAGATREAIGQHGDAGSTRTVKESHRRRDRV